MPYIPRFNPMSMQEVMFAPSMMRQQHEQMDLEAQELSKKFKVDHLDKDTDILKPKLKEYDQNISDISTKLSREGFSHNNRSNLKKLKSDFENDEIINQARSNYITAQQGWRQQEANMLKNNDPSWYIQNAKQRYFNNPDYKGVVDDKGNLQQFNPGATTGYKDIAKEFTKYAKQLGYSTLHQDLGKMGVKFGFETAPTGQSFLTYQITKPGTAGSTNEAQLQNLVSMFNRDLSDPRTDLGLSRDISGFDNQYISETLNNLQGMYFDTKGGQAPSMQVGMQQVKAPSNEGLSNKLSNVGGFYFPRKELNLDVSEQVLSDSKDVKAAIKSISENKDFVEVTVPEEKLLEIQNKYQIQENEVQNIIKRYPQFDRKKALNVILGQKRIAVPELLPTGIKKTNKDVLDEYKNKYSDIYIEGMSDKSFMQAVDKYLDEKKVTSNSLFSLDSPKAAENLERNILDEEGLFERVKKGDISKGSKKSNFAKIKESYESGTYYDRRPVFFNDDLDIVLQDGGNSIYKMTKPLNEIHSEIKTQHSFLKAIYNDTSISKEEIDYINSRGAISIPGDPNTLYKLKINRDGNGKLQKYVEIPTQDEFGQPSIKRISLKDFVTSVYPYTAMPILFTDITTTN